MAHANLNLAVLLLCCFLHGTASQNLNPCEPTQPSDIEQGKGFVIGLAYWPGGSIADWGNASAGLHPCFDDEGLLVTAGVEIATFEIEVDKMALLRTSRFTEAQLFDQAQRSNGPDVVSVVAFAGKYRSEARYIWSDDASITGGTGVVNTLSLIPDFDEGRLEFLRWRNVGCNGCDDSQCIKTTQPAQTDLAESSACASFSISDCACGRSSNNRQCASPADEPFRCHTGFQVATSGEDKNSKPLKTGLQLQRINALSLTNLYNRAADGAGDAFKRGQEAFETIKNATTGFFG